MTFAAVRNMICVVSYLCLRVVMDVCVFFFIDILFGSDIYELNMETLAYALDMREWYPVLVMAVMREIIALVGVDRRVKNAGNGKERMCVGVGKGGSARRMMVEEEEEEYVDCKDGGDVQGEDEDEKQDEMEYELEWLFVDEGGEGLVVKEGRRVNLLKECYDMFKDKSYSGLVGLFWEDVMVQENEEEEESDFGLVDLFGADGVYLEEDMLAAEAESEGEEFPIQCYDLLQEILLELEGSAEVFADEATVDEGVVDDSGDLLGDETVDDDDVVGDGERVFDEEAVEDVVVELEAAKESEEEEEKDGVLEEVDVMAGEKVHDGERVGTEAGVNEGEGRMLMYESESDEIETGYDDEDIEAVMTDSDSEYVGDGEESYDSGLERSEGLAKSEEKYERRSIEDLILFFESISK